MSLLHIVFLAIHTNSMDQSTSREVGYSRNSLFVESEDTLLFASEDVSPPYPEQDKANQYLSIPFL